METPNDYTIFHEYLQTACEAEMENDHAKATRLLKKLAWQYAAPGQTSKLQAELTDFCSWIIGEVEDDMGWYFLNDNLTGYLKLWQKQGLIYLERSNNHEAKSR